MSDTLRTQILNAMVTSMEGMQTNIPLADPYGVSWSIVTREPLNGVPAGKKTALGIYGGTTRRSYVTSYQEIIMPVIIEIYVNTVSMAAENQTSTVESYLGAVERRLFEDLTLGGLACNIQVSGEQVIADGLYANNIQAALFFDVTYFQSQSDPRKARG